MLRKPGITLVALFLSACAGSPGEPGIVPPPPSPAPPPPPPPIDGGEWGTRSGLIEPNSELPIAELNGKLYLLGGYPSSRQSVRTVQIYDIASDKWEIGPQLPQLNNHGMAASVNGKVYLIGGQTLADGDPFVDTVYELDPAKGQWVEKARMPTARSAGVALVHEGKIYVAGGRPPRGNDFAVYDPAADKWEALPNLPSQRNHMTGAVINGRIHVVGGRLGPGLVASQNDSARSLRPANKDLDDRGAHAERPQRHERSHGPGLLPRLGRRGRERHDTRTMSTTILGPTNGHASATCRSPFTASTAQFSKTV